MHPSVFLAPAQIDAVMKLALQSIEQAADYLRHSAQPDPVLNTCMDLLAAGESVADTASFAAISERSFQRKLKPDHW